jgi:hypothetical protein
LLERKKKKRTKKLITAFSHTFLHSLSTDLAIIIIIIVIIIIKITGATEKKCLFYICVHEDIEKKGTKMGHHTAKKKRSKKLHAK